MLLLSAGELPEIGCRCRAGPPVCPVLRRDAALQCAVRLTSPVWATLSATVRLEYIALEHDAVVTLGRWCRVISRPPCWIVPAVGVSSPAMILSSVVLPAPRRAEEADEFTPCDVQINRFQGSEGTELLVTPESLR